MPNRLKRSFTLLGKNSSISMEPDFWIELKGIAARDNKTISGLINDIRSSCKHSNLSSACRIYILEDVKRRLVERDGQ